MFINLFMVKIKLFLNKDINENSNYYFQKAKKLKGKLPGVEKTIDKIKKDIEEFEWKKEKHLERKKKEEKLNLHKKKEWFEKFRYTKTSSGFLCVFGKDAGTNEVLVKKHMDEKDIVLHTEEPGSPFGLIKGGRDEVSKDDILECAQFLACFSAQWKKGFGTADVFWVYPEQVSKKAVSGEYVAKGAFMVYGDKNILKNVPLKIGVGVEKKKIVTDDETIEFEEVFSGGFDACKKFCGSRFVKLEPGKDTYKALTKTIKKRLKLNSIEDLPKYVPNNSKVLKK